jgi:protein-tyrosine phosphatase
MNAESMPSRHVPLEGQTNFRDLGGYATVDGQQVRRGQVFRSGRLTMLSDADLDQLGLLGIRTVVNLLTEDDVTAYGQNRIPRGARELTLPIDSETATELANRATSALRSGDFSEIPRSLNPVIHRILTHDGRVPYRLLLETIAEPSNRPLVFHCSHGIHRTGTAAAILLSVLGVRWETVEQDYLLSNKYRRQEVERRLRELNALAARAGDIPLGDVDMSNAEAFLIQERSYIDAARGEILGEFESFEQYAQEGLGLQPETIKSLRKQLVNNAGVD